ncbi:hypothetical protein [Enterobacter cloacae]|uniref:hypothetical protein n=1 Tax=Enterobacter cloacae TaxID=550 RepID=UPI0021CE568A|nr:hypothetical protein [Enterobacter cloacae]
MLISSCVTRGSVPVVVDTACDWVKPIYLTDHDIAVMDRQTKKDILAHNKAWHANCRRIIPLQAAMIRLEKSGLVLIKSVYI